MSSLRSKIESLLFISAKPMSEKQLSTLLKREIDEVRLAGEELVEFYRDKKAGIQIIKNGSKFQMVSSPENSRLVQEFISDETTGDLSRPSLETLTIIAYRGPITKLDVEKIRGVNCAIILRNLLLRGLVETRTGESEEDLLYTVTFDFIRYLGINDISELPNYEKLNSEEAVSDLLSTKEEDEPEADKYLVNTDDQKSSDDKPDTAEQVSPDCSIRVEFVKQGLEEEVKDDKDLREEN